MADPFIGEIRIFAGNFAPVNWAFCDGSLIAISENQALYALIGTTYGGDGINTFALPDLRGRVAIHQGTSSSQTPYVLGQRGGAEAVTLTTQQIPAHSHAAMANAAATTGNPTGGVFAGGVAEWFVAGTPGVVMNNAMIGSTGGSQPHENMPPYAVISYIISLFGVFPSQG